MAWINPNDESFEPSELMLMAFEGGIQCDDAGGPALDGRDPTCTRRDNHNGRHMLIGGDGVNITVISAWPADHVPTDEDL